MIALNKEQTDQLKLTRSDDPNDVIFVDENGEIKQRRPMIASFPFELRNGNKEYITEYSWMELENGKWKYKTKKYK